MEQLPSKTPHKKRVRYVIPAGMKYCPECQHMHKKEDFQSGYCGPAACNCQRKYHTNWTRENRRENTAKLVSEALEAYGGKCAECGELDPRVLVIVPRGGNGVRNFMYWLRERGYPEGYRVLCRNCEAKVDPK